MKHGNGRAELFEVLAMLSDADEAERFLLDIASPAEIEAFADRWRIVRMLSGESLSYREIAAATGASTTTIGRVARFLKDEPHGGYRSMLARIARNEQ